MKKETIKAIVNTLVVVAVTVSSAFGIDIDGDMLVNVMCSIILVAATVYGCWKNHNFTEAAQEGQLLIDEIKANKWRNTLLDDELDELDEDVTTTEETKE